jgi:Ca-activated chloride channel family protein
MSDLSRTRVVFFAILGIALLIILGGVVVGLLAPRLLPTDSGRPAPDETPGSGSQTTPSPPRSGSVVVTVFSSSTKQDWLNAVIEQFNAQGKTTSSGKTIVVEASHGTSGGSRQDILDGNLQPVVWSPGDQSWVGQINLTWQQRHNKPLIGEACPPTVYAPIGFAMWHPMAEAMGWPDAPIGWDTIVALAANAEGWGAYGHPEWGQFNFGHTHPAYSNSGLLSMISFVYGIMGSERALTGAEVYRPEVERAMRALEQNTSKYGHQSSALFELMVSEGPSYLHAIAASEETTLRYNISHADELRFPLVFVFPAGGTIWADHPYCILDNAEWVSEEEGEGAAIFREYLLAREQQAMTIDHRLRPVDSSISLRAPLDLASGTDPRVTTAIVPALPSPSDEVSAAVIDMFLLTKRKATVVVALDLSTSMKGAKIKAATAATAEFLCRLDPSDEVAVLTFSDSVVTLSEPAHVRDVAEGLAGKVSTLYADGSTALYDAVCQAAALADDLRREDQAQGESRLYGIVLLSDGEDTMGRPTENEMFTTCLPASAEAQGTKIFPIAFGADADQNLLERMAKVTGGRMWTADPDSIAEVYFAISAEQ